MIGGVTVQLFGDPSLTRRACTSEELKSLETEDEVWVLWNINASPAVPNFDSHASLSAEQRTKLEVLISEFSVITQPLLGLPPSCPHDH